MPKRETKRAVRPKRLSKKRLRLDELRPQTGDPSPGGVSRRRSLADNKGNTRFPRNKLTRAVLPRVNWDEEDFARQVPLQLDLPGILYVEAAQKIDRGVERLTELRNALHSHHARIAVAATGTGVDAWGDVLQGVGGLEAKFAATVSELAVADVLLVAAAEAYVNAVAAQVLAPSASEQFEKLSPVGKWLFLPRLMKLKWLPALDRGCLQQFAELASRRNRVVHPRVVKVAGAVDIEAFLKKLSLDERVAKNGRKAVADLIRELCNSWRGSSGPDWLCPENAKDRPPCFILGNVASPGRLARPGERFDDNDET